MSEQTKIELLAPAKDIEAGLAAIDYGADAVYIGATRFGARHAAGNTVEDIARLAHYAHLFGVRVYATLNTIVYDSELADAERIARELLAAGVDALIIQDMAYLRMGLEGVEFHASTQTSNIRAEDVAFLGKAGFRRIILERALSINEIELIRAVSDTQLEVFIHGAICVGHSGRCFMSRSTSARSGNRGECSQPCRLAYDLTNGEGEIILKSKHLLSLLDLDLSAHIPTLLDAGVTSFKIEGRLKGTNYIKNVVSHYRRVLDKALAVRAHLGRASVGESAIDFTPQPSKSFTRGATDYFFNGAVQGVASFDTPKSIGTPLGRVDKTGDGFFVLKEAGEVLSAGDGICFVSSGELKGTNINRVDGVRIYPHRMEGIERGAWIYRNYDHEFNKVMERSRVKRRIYAEAEVRMQPDSISIIFTDETGVKASVSRKGAFEEPKNPEKMESLLCEQLSKSGDTIFAVRKVNRVGDVRFVPSSILNELRREALQMLFEERSKLLPERHPCVEDMSARFPREVIAANENVVNALAAKFYRDHGVIEIETGLDLSDTMNGVRVMRTKYCIRREIGKCLKDESGVREELYLERGHARFHLEFDCTACEMSLIYIDRNAGRDHNADSENSC